MIEIISIWALLGPVFFFVSIDTAMAGKWVHNISSFQMVLTIIIGGPIVWSIFLCYFIMGVLND